MLTTELNCPQRDLVITEKRFLDPSTLDESAEFKLSPLMITAAKIIDEGFIIEKNDMEEEFLNIYYGAFLQEKIDMCRFILEDLHCNMKPYQIESDARHKYVKGLFATLRAEKAID